MSKEYAETKIREALTLHSGNITKARKQIAAWAQEDIKLLHGLSRPHLDGIVAYQVERIASGRAELEKRHPEVKQEEQKKEDDFGMELLRAVAARSVPVFGLGNNSAPNKRKTASKQHIDAIHKMASSRHDTKK